MTYEESHAQQRVLGDRFRSFITGYKSDVGRPHPGFVPKFEVRVIVMPKMNNPFSSIGVYNIGFHYYITHHVTENLMREYLSLNSFCWSEWLNYRFSNEAIVNLTVNLERILGGCFISPYAKEEFDSVLYNIMSNDSTLKALLNHGTLTPPKPKGKIAIWAKGLKRWYKDHFEKVPASSIKNHPVARFKNPKK